MAVPTGALTVLAAVAVDLAGGEGAAGSSPAVAPAVSLTETPGGPPLYCGGLDDFVDRVVPLAPGTRGVPHRVHRFNTPGPPGTSSSGGAALSRRAPARQRGCDTPVP
ncbi:hypothetical protein ND808_39995 [Streptomyces sp. DR7-3]|nr:hypothetical protein [Streptomyces sp. DR7-3]MCM3811941.1 hypothetical protein [Streptomyces sp. DR7-3]